MITQKLTQTGDFQFSLLTLDVQIDLLRPLLEGVRAARAIDLPNMAAMMIFHAI